MSADSISVGEIFTNRDTDLSSERVELDKARHQAEERIAAIVEDIRGLASRHRSRAQDLRAQADIEDQIASRYEQFLTGNALEDQAASGIY